VSHVVRIDPESWPRLRRIRLDSLREDPDAFGARWEEQSRWSEQDWRDSIANYCYLVANDGVEDVAMMFVETLEGDFGATCWVGGCWTRAAHRGRGHLRRLFDYVDAHARDEGWLVQGLGVWTHNVSALSAYERLGFTKRGAERSSTSHPGWSYQRMIRHAVIDAPQST